MPGYPRWIPDTYDVDDKYYDTSIFDRRVEKKVILTVGPDANLLLPVYNQVDTNGCVANATAAAYRWAARKQNIK